VDATPVWFMRQAGRALPAYRRIRERASLAEIVADAELCAEVSMLPVEQLGVDAAIVFADITTPLPGIGVQVGPVVTNPIRQPGDVDRLSTFDADAVGGALPQAIGMLKRASPVPVIGFAGAPFTLASYLIEGQSPRGLETTKRFLFTEPGAWHTLMTRLVDLDLAYLRAQVTAGADAVQVFDSWVGGLAPVDYRKSVLPHMRRLFDGLSDLGVPTIHFGTATGGLLELMAEAGGDVIGLDWRIDLAAGWARLRDRAVQGNLDPAVLLGPWSVTADRARLVLEQAAGRSGHVFNLGHGVLPATDPDDLRRLVDLVHETTTRVAVPA
jgi:uroporphyrinogen decarboxylase